MKKDSIIWDKTNIGENYPGVTLPFTYSFLKNAYSQVYYHFLLRLGVSPKVLEDNRSVFDNMIGYLNGNIYYNLSNWYELLKMLPGYSYNRHFFETMLEPAQKGGGNRETKLKPAIFWQNRRIFINFTSAALIFTPLKKEFTRRFTRLNQNFQEVDLSKQTPVELVTHFLNLQNRFFNLWAITIINDFRVMIFFGMLDAFVKKYFQDPVQTLQQLHHLKKQPTSLLPLKKLREISKNIQQDQELLSLFTLQPSQILHRLSKPQYAGLNQLIKEYQKDFGDRFENELKLESKTLKQEPEKIIVLLKHYCQSSEEIRVKQFSTFNANRRPQWLYQSVYRLLLLRTISAIHTREHFRFKRAQAFNIARSLVVEMGKRMADWQQLDEAEDIFYLYADEVFDYLRFHRHSQPFKSIIRSRKKTYRQYQKITMPRRLVTDGNPAMVGQAAASQKQSPSHFTGMTTSPGQTVIAPVIVQKNLDLSADFRGKILVAHATDPGWTVVFPLVKAVVTEYGGMLSHASIVARELGIPCIVKAAGITRLKTGDTVKLDPKSATITLVT